MPDTKYTFREVSYCDGDYMFIDNDDYDDDHFMMKVM